MTRRRITVTSAARGQVVHTDPAKGVDGEFVIQAAADRTVNWILNPSESRSYVTRSGEDVRVRVTPDGGSPIDKVAARGASVAVVF